MQQFRNRMGGGGGGGRSEVGGRIDEAEVEMEGRSKKGKV